MLNLQGCGLSGSPRCGRALIAGAVAENATVTFKVKGEELVM
ncbi:MAG: hypothetical protein PHE83_15600 [Opitutaceae bacterium]|nr:hypothetical protein [Opitutaceae bacterium]